MWTKQRRILRDLNKCLSLIVWRKTWPLARGNIYQHKYALTIAHQNHSFWRHNQKQNKKSSPISDAVLINQQGYPLDLFLLRPVAHTLK